MLAVRFPIHANDGMLPMKSNLLATLILLAPFASLSADEQLDKALAEIEALRQQVQSLEQRVAALEATDNAPPAPHLLDAPPPSEIKERKNWFDNMRVELKKAEARDSGPWTSPAVWNSVKVGMKEEDVIELLGEPTHRKFSLRKDTDVIFIYESDLTGDGEPVRGEVRIYKGEVRRFETPDFPPQ